MSQIDHVRAAPHGIACSNVVASGALVLMLSGCISVPVNLDRTAFAQSPARNAIPAGEVVLRRAETLLLDVRLDRQVAQNGCGAHAVSSLVDYWQRLGPGPTSFAPEKGTDIYGRTPPRDSSGYSIAEIVELLESRGLESLAVNSTTSDLKAELLAGRPSIVRVSVAASELRTLNILPPNVAIISGLETRAFAISSWLFGQERLDHYWIMMGFDSSRIIVLDPALGVRSVTTEAFEAAFNAGGRLAVVSGGWAPA